MSGWIARRLARALLARDPRVVVEVAWSDDGTSWSVRVEHARDASPLAIAGALRAMADAIASTTH